MLWAPLISLFGERVTKQYLSESISLLDNLIFALAPLGILASVISVIRVCGNPSLRAFIGRAQEGPGEAARELLSCMSETTAEVFNEVVSREFSDDLGLLRWSCGRTRFRRELDNARSRSEHYAMPFEKKLAIVKGMSRRNLKSKTFHQPLMCQICRLTPESKGGAQVGSTLLLP